MASDKENSFELHYQKLAKLSEELQQNKVSIDQLVPRIQEALQSLRVCKDVLKKTRVQLEHVSNEFAEIEKQGEPTSSET